IRKPQCTEQKKYAVHICALVTSSGEQEWQAQPNIPPEPNPGASLLPFFARRKEVASADAK
ncbi:MAG: hypothetical protein IIX99_05335, partial [Oscillospiraceae bacterium]|nr:hypothetical protein [Oscillospiraceae bacterium]